MAIIVVHTYSGCNDQISKGMQHNKGDSGITFPDEWHGQVTLLFGNTCWVRWTTEKFVDTPEVVHSYHARDLITFWDKNCLCTPADNK